MIIYLFFLKKLSCSITKLKKKLKKKPTRHIQLNSNVEVCCHHLITHFNIYFFSNLTIERVGESVVSILAPFIKHFLFAIWRPITRVEKLQIVSFYLDWKTFFLAWLCLLVKVFFIYKIIKIIFFLFLKNYFLY
jgi:hypothetical protein